MIVAKRDSADDRKRQKTEARIGLASNVLGIAAGTAALAGTAQNPALRDPSVANAGPVTRRLLHRNPSARLTPLGRKLVRGGAAGAVALQAANLGGDIVANRVLSREAKKGDPVRKSIEQSLVSKSAGVRVTGRGVNIAKAEPAIPKFTDEEHRAYDRDTREVRAANRRVGRVQGASTVGLVGGLAGGYGGAVLGGMASRGRPPGNRVALAAGTGLALGGLGGAILGGKVGAGAGDRRAQRFMADPNVKYLTMSGRRELARREKAVAKRYYDPEMDRQRRLGMYAGLGLGGGAGLIALGGKGIRPAKRMVEDGRVVRGLAMPKGKAAAAKLALVGGGLLATGGGLAAYKRSNSRANDPWD